MGEIVAIGDVGNGAAWRELEPMVRDVVAGLGVGQKGADWIFEDICRRDFQMVHMRPTDWDLIPEESRVHLAKISQELKGSYIDIMTDWLRRIVALEADLYRARFERPRVEVIEGGKGD